MKRLHFLIPIAATIALASCSDDNTFKIDGVNIIGTWAAFGSGYEYDYVDCNDSEDEINILYEFKSDGTYSYISYDYECDCSREFVNGYIDCDRSHFSEDGEYSWKYTNGKLIIAGAFPTTVKKISNDEIKITYSDWTCTLKRVKGYRSANKADSTDDDDLSSENESGSGPEDFTTTIQCTGKTCNISGVWANEYETDSDGKVSAIYEFADNWSISGRDGYYAYAYHYLGSAADTHYCTLTMTNWQLNCSLSHMNHSGNYVWRISNAGKSKSTIYWDNEIYTVTDIASDDEFTMRSSYNIYTFKRIKSFTPTEFDDSFDFYNVTKGKNYSFEAIVTGIAKVGIAVSNRSGNAIIYNKSIDWSKYKIGTIVEIQGTASNYHGGLEFINPVIEVKSDKVAFTPITEYWDGYNLRNWISDISAVSTATSGMLPSKRIQITTTLCISDGAYNYMVAGSDTPIRLYSATDSLKALTATDGETYILTGYMVDYNQDTDIAYLLVVNVNGNDV